MRANLIVRMVSKFNSENPSGGLNGGDKSRLSDDVMFEDIKATVWHNNDILSALHRDFIEAYLIQLERRVRSLSDAPFSEQRHILDPRKHGGRFLLRIADSETHVNGISRSQHLNALRRDVRICKSLLSSFRFLPPEIINTILRIVATGNLASPQTICSVCYTWRKIALNLSTFWHMDAIRFCHNSQRTLDCMVWDNQSADDQTTDNNLRGILPFMPQVEKLYVTGSILSKILLLRSSTLIALKHIIIEDFDSRDLPKTGARLLTDVKSLRTASLSVSDCRLIFPLLPLKRLTHIELHSSVHCRGVFDFLQGCLNLQELSVREFTWAKYYPLELMGRHTILPNLKKLRVRLHRTPFRNLLGRIRIPYLESLELVTIDGPLSLNDIRFPLQGIRYLCISLKALAHAELIKLVSACKSLLSLTFVVQWEQGVLQSLMKALADYVVLLPIIQSFSLVFDGGDHFEEGFRGVTSLMRCWLQIGPRRRALTNVAFTLRTSGYEGRLSWQRSLKGLRHCLKMWIRTTDEKDGVLLSDEIVDLRGPQWTT